MWVLLHGEKNDSRRVCASRLHYPACSDVEAKLLVWKDRRLPISTNLNHTIAQPQQRVQQLYRPGAITSRMRELLCFMQQVVKENSGIGDKQVLRRSRTFMAVALGLLVLRLGSDSIGRGWYNVFFNL